MSHKIINHGVYLTEKDVKLTEKVAKMLKNEGIIGIMKSDGSINRSALFRYLLHRTERQLSEKAKMGGS